MVATFVDSPRGGPGTPGSAPRGSHAEGGGRSPRCVHLEGLLADEGAGVEAGRRTGSRAPRGPMRDLGARLHVPGPGPAPAHPQELSCPGGGVGVDLDDRGRGSACGRRSQDLGHQIRNWTRASTPSCEDPVTGTPVPRLPGRIGTYIALGMGEDGRQAGTGRPNEPEAAICTRRARSETRNSSSAFKARSASLR